MAYFSCQKVLLPSFFAGSLALVGCLQPADSILEKSDQAGKIVFVKQNSTQNNNNIAMAANPSEFYRGTDIVMLSPISPSGVITNLTAPYTRGDQEPRDWGAAEDPEISYDGKKLLFSMVTAGSRTRQWNLYEMDLPTGVLTQLTNPIGTASDMDPAYLPDGRIVFTSTRNQIVDEYERRPAPQLFIGERGTDGMLTNLRQLSFNQSHDQNPFVHSSGLIYFTRWDHLGNPNKMPLFSIHPDGTRQFVLYGSDETFTGTLTSGMRTFMEARELSDGGIISSIMERTSPFEGGAIGIIDLGAGISSPPQMITNTQYNFEGRDVTAGSIFKTPYPIADHGRERILVAQSTADVGGGANGASNFDIYVMDKNGGNMSVVHLDPNYNDYDPVVVAPHARPTALPTDPNVANGIASGMTTGFFFDANVYSRDRSLDGQMAPALGSALYLRVLEAIPLSTTGGLRGGSLGETNFEKQRVIGYADIQSDGSFAIEVPAMKSLHVQVLDENAMALVNQLQWIHVQPGEQRVCTGCHGARNRDGDIDRIHYNTAVDSVYIDDGMIHNYMASFGRAQKVWQHTGVRSDSAVDFYNPWALANDTTPDFRLPARVSTVQAVLDRNCVSCHNVSTPNRVILQEGAPNVAAVKLDMDDNEEVSSVYRRLVFDGYLTARNDTLPYAIYNTSSRGGGARQSPLAWVLYNKQLDGQTVDYRATSFDHSTLWTKDGSGNILPFDPANADLRTLVEWLDMGAQFSNSTGDLTP